MKKLLWQVLYFLKLKCEEFWDCIALSKKRLEGLGVIIVGCLIIVIFVVACYGIGYVSIELFSFNPLDSKENTQLTVTMIATGCMFFIIPILVFTLLFTIYTIFEDIKTFIVRNWRDAGRLADNKIDSSINKKGEN